MQNKKRINTQLSTKHYNTIVIGRIALFYDKKAANA